MAITQFHEVRFPDDIAEGALGGPSFSTDVVTVNSGAEQRNQNWSESRGEWSVGHGVKTQEQLDELIAFFRCRRGKAYGFRYKDFSDYKAINQPAIKITSTIYQLAKQYVSGTSDYTYTRTIRKIVGGTVKVYVNGTERTTGKTIDINAGLLILDPPPGEGTIVTASFEFDVPVRFDTDKMSVSINNFNIYDWNNITLIELKE